MKTRLYPPRHQYLISIIPQQILFIAISVFVAWKERIELFRWPQHSAGSWLLGGMIVVGLIALMRPYWRAAVARRERHIYLFMPQGNAEKALWVVISLGAGIGEEVVYRGVMTTLLVRQTASLWFAILLCASIFALSHLIQGWQNVVLILSFSLVFHALTWMTESLLVPMAIHFLYNLVAGLSYSRFGDALGYPVEDQESPS